MTTTTMATGNGDDDGDGAIGNEDDDDGDRTLGDDDDDDSNGNAMGNGATGCDDNYYGWHYWGNGDGE